MDFYESEDADDMHDGFPHATPAPREIYVVGMPPWAWGLLAFTLGALVERARRGG